MMIAGMLSEEMERVKSIMASAGVRKMLQGTWWLTVTQFCLEGLVIEGERGMQLARRFADAMLEDVIDPQVRDSHRLPQIATAPMASDGLRWPLMASDCQRITTDRH